MKSPREMEDTVELYTYYLTLGVLALFVIMVLMLVIHFVVGLLVAISMGG